MSDYKDAKANEGKLESEGHAQTPAAKDDTNTSINSKKHFNVLNEDGSLATDLPKGSHPGEGSNEGSVGLGT